MEEDFIISILGKLPQEVIEELKQTPVDERCVFTKEADCEVQEYFVDAEQQYILEIRGKYIVECSPKTKKIIGGIRLSLDYKFEIKRFVYSFESELGQPFAFVLYFPEQEEEQVIIKLGVDMDDAEQLEKFSACLERKQICQLQLYQNFKVTQRLCRSSSACVYGATRLRDSKSVAIKCIKKEIFTHTGRALKVKWDLCRKDQRDHHGICKFFGIFQSESTVYLIMELLPINLLEFAQKRCIKSELQLWKILQGICVAVQFIHSKNIMHRDLKLENIMMRPTGDDQYEPVIIDFGLAEYEGKLPYIFTRCGTPGYTAPEIVHSDKDKPQYDKQCDIFSLGCLFYCLIMRKPLFHGKNLEEVINKNKQCEIDENDPSFDQIHPCAKNLLLKMLNKNPHQRIKIWQILEHPFFAQEPVEQQMNKLKEKETIFVSISAGSEEKQEIEQ